MTSKVPLALSAFALIILSAETVDDKWPQFRGPGGSGVGDDKVTLPSEFGPGKALLWKTDLPLGHGSPCVWGERIFVTAFDPASHTLEVISVNRKDGKIVWRQTVSAKEIEKVHSVSSPATSTPATDGEKVYVYLGSYGILAYEWNGSLAWEYPMGVSKSPYGSGTSPVLAGDLVLVPRDYPPDPYLLAVHKKDGKLAWKADLVKPTQPRASDFSRNPGHLERPDRPESPRRSIRLRCRRWQKTMVVSDGVGWHVNALGRRRGSVRQRVQHYGRSGSRRETADKAFGDSRLGSGREA